MCCLYKTRAITWLNLSNILSKLLLPSMHTQRLCGISGACGTVRPWSNLAGAVINYRGNDLVSYQLEHYIYIHTLVFSTLHNIPSTNIYTVNIFMRRRDNPVAAVCHLFETLLCRSSNVWLAVKSTCLEIFGGGGP